MATKAAPPPKTQRRPAPARKQAGPRTPALEWASAAVGLILIVLVIGLLVARSLTAGGVPRLTADIVKQAEGVITVEVTNHGGSAASDVEVEAQAVAAGAPVSGNVTIAYVPSGSSRKAVLLLDPAAQNAAVRVRVKGYLVP